MEFLFTALGIIIGIILCASSFYGYRKIKQNKKRKQSFASTSYDIRIDEVTESGSERYKLHKAMVDPERRNAIRGTPLWDKAAPLLGWDD